jgi:hypothetical protein
MAQQHFLANRETEMVLLALQVFQVLFLWVHGWIPLERPYPDWPYDWLVISYACFSSGKSAPGGYLISSDRNRGELLAIESCSAKRIPSCRRAMEWSQTPRIFCSIWRPPSTGCSPPGVVPSDGPELGLLQHSNNLLHRKSSFFMHSLPSDFAED